MCCPHPKLDSPKLIPTDRGTPNAHGGRWKRKETKSVESWSFRQTNASIVIMFPQLTKTARRGSDI
eukprot:565622-Prorocentrum_minimum.AAC.1